MSLTDALWARNCAAVKHYVALHKKPGKTAAFFQIVGKSIFFYQPLGAFVAEKGR
jgi:hypothetical protein